MFRGNIMSHVIKNTNQHVDVKKFGENWDLIAKSKKKKVKPRQAAKNKKEEIPYNPFVFVKY